VEDDYNAMAAIRDAIGNSQVVIPSVFQLSDDLGRVMIGV
jgi:hypothetical protein